MKTAKKIPLSKYDWAKGIHLEFKWTVSRGRDTYGYNICTLYVNGDRVSSCSGGGYDMQGTALGDWIEAQFSEELKTLEAHWTEGEYPNDNYKRHGLCGLYFLRAGAKYSTVGSWEEGDRVSVDGGVGFSCMKEILLALGFELDWIRSRKKNNDQFIMRTARIETEVA